MSSSSATAEPTNSTVGDPSVEFSASDFASMTRVLALRGPESFEALARKLQRLCGVDCVVIAQLYGAPHRSARAIAWADADEARAIKHMAFEWPISGTPYANAVPSAVVNVAADAFARFPDDQLLASGAFQAHLGLPLFDDAGEFIGIVSLLHQTSFEFSPSVVSIARLFASRAGTLVEQLMATQQRGRTEEQLELALSAARMGAWYWDVVSTEVRWDTGFCDLLGFPHDLTSASLPGLMSMLPRVARSQLSKTISEGANGLVDDQIFELQWPIEGQGTRTLRAMGRLFRDAQKRPTRVAGVLWDVTAERESRDKLVRSEQRYRGYFDLGLVGLAQLSPEGEWTEVNEELCRMLGVSRSQLIGHQVSDLLDRPERRRLTRHFRRAKEDGRDSIFDELNLRRADGTTLFATASLRVQRDAQGQPESYVALVVDLTERRRLESQLIQSQKLEAVGRLAGGVAHDFNNVLAVVLSSATLLEGKVPRGSPQQELVTAILDSAERGARLTNQMLAFARPQPIPTKVIDARQVLQRSLKMLRQLVGSKIELDVRADVETAVRIEVVQLEQILMNLLVNARDAMPSGGTIKIVLDTTVLSGDGIDDLPAGAYVRLHVADTGNGMTPEAVGRVFEPFFTTKGAGGGTGLGLATCHSVVKQVGGSIQVESRLGEGTDFTILLPQQRGVTVDNPVPPGKRDAGSSLRVLLVEDEKRLSDAVSRMLSTAGHDVLTAADASEALSLLETGRFDVLFSDVLMPGMTGVELGRIARLRHPGLPLVLASAQGRPEGAEEEIFLQKPYSLSDLLSALDEAAAGSSPVAAAG